MIVRISRSGKSFKGLGTYLLHDPKAATSARVAWTHTLNLANDAVAPAIDEMIQTARNAELLKQECGIRAGGRVTQTTVKHISLNWSPDESPVREQMIEAAEAFLRHMNWHDRQTVLIVHTDKHPHVHLMINTVHPQTGLKIDENFERRRAQKWALDYERAQNRIYCAQRLRKADAREKSMPRHAWEAFRKKQNHFENAEKTLFGNQPHNAENTKKAESKFAAEWKFLKDFQRREREAFFTDGKSAFSNLRKSVYREVRAEFRARWAGYYKAREKSSDRAMLAVMKAGIIGDQKIILAARRDADCKKLRENRDRLYRYLLDRQREIRAELRSRQEAGLDNTEFLRALVSSAKAEPNTSPGYRQAAEAAASRTGAPERGSETHKAMKKIKAGAPVTGNTIETGSCVNFGTGFSFPPLGHSPPRKSEGGRSTAPPGKMIAECFIYAAKQLCHGRFQPQRDPKDEREPHQRKPIVSPVALVTTARLTLDDGDKALSPNISPIHAGADRLENEAQRNTEIADFGPDEHEGEAADIDITYRRKLAGLRYLPPHLRAQARRAAKEWRRLALKALREKRSVEAYARRALARSRSPPRMAGPRP